PVEPDVGCAEAARTLRKRRRRQPRDYALLRVAPQPRDGARRPITLPAADVGQEAARVGRWGSDDTDAGAAAGFDDVERAFRAERESARTVEAAHDAGQRWVQGTWAAACNRVMPLRRGAGDRSERGSGGESQRDHDRARA